MKNNIKALTDVNYVFTDEEYHVLLENYFLSGAKCNVHAQNKPVYAEQRVS